MVINRDMRQAQVYKLAGQDEYAQPTYETESSQTISLTFGLFNHSPVEDIRYQNVEYTGLTKDLCAESDLLKIGDNFYRVIFVNPFGRLNQVFLHSAND